MVCNSRDLKLHERIIYSNGIYFSQIRRQQFNRIASSNDVTLPKDKNGKYIQRKPF